MELKKVFVILVFLMLISTTVFAATGIITNASSGLILRAEPSKNGNVIFTIANGKEVEILGKEVDWYKVKYNNQEGYLFAEFVKVEEVAVSTEAPKKEETNISGNTASVNTDIDIYLMPQITSTVILTIAKDTQITVVEEVGKWSYVNVNNTLGWVRTARIKGETNQNEEVPAEKPQETAKQQTEKPETKQEEPKTVETGLKKGYINVSSAFVREQPSKDSNAVTTLLLNTEVSITEETEEWYKINFQDKYFGYVAKYLISGNPQ